MKFICPISTTLASLLSWKHIIAVSAVSAVPEDARDKAC